MSQKTSLTFIHFETQQKHSKKKLLNFLYKMQESQISGHKN